MIAAPRPPARGVASPADATAAASPDRPLPAARRPGPAGVLIVDKPTGVTSHDVIDVVRRRLREKAAGHLGTLDPMASGLLAVALGAATRCVPVWQRGEKTYEASLRLGVETDTQDTSGEVRAVRPVAATEADLRAAAASQVGERMQVPPMVSAVRVGGERLYRLARRGVEVERAPRPIHVRSWHWLEFDLPRARFRVCCSSGTYVRTLAHDLGASLGCGAALESLRRLSSEPFDLTRCVTVRDLYVLPPEAVWERAGIPLDDALGSLPALTLDETEVRAIGYGAAIALDRERAAAAPLAAGPRSLVLRDGAGRALALGEARPDAAGAGFLAHPQVVFPWAVREGRPSAP